MQELLLLLRMGRHRPASASDIHLLSPHDALNAHGRVEDSQPTATHIRRLLRGWSECGQNRLPFRPCHHCQQFGQWYSEESSHASAY